MKKISLCIWALLITVFLSTVICSQARAGSENEGTGWLISKVKQAVVFLGHQEVQKDGTIKNVYEGTGCIIEIDNFFHVLTAKHVITRKGETPAEDMKFFLNRKDGTVSIHSFEEIKRKFDIDWVFPKDPNVDLAVIPIELNVNQDIFKVVPQSLFQSTEKLYELYDAFFLSYQPGAADDDIVSPVVRAATLSLIKPDGTFLIGCGSFAVI